MEIIKRMDGRGGKGDPCCSTRFDFSLSLYSFPDPNDDDEERPNEIFREELARVESVARRRKNAAESITHHIHRPQQRLRFDVRVRSSPSKFLGEDQNPPCLNGHLCRPRLMPDLLRLLILHLQEKSGMHDCFLSQNEVWS